jgi:hypothetical protein
MGGSSSKPVLTAPVPQLAQPDISHATFSGDYIANLAKQNQEAQAAAAQVATDAQAAAAAALTAASRWRIGFISFGVLLGILVLIVFGILLYDVWARNNHQQTIFLPGLSSFTNFREGMDVQTSAGSSPYSSSTAPPLVSSLPGATGPTGPTGPAGISGPAKGTGQAPPPPLAYQYLYGSGNMPGNIDASSSAVIPAASAPLSSGPQGAYGIQWWMFIKDWNDGYGKEKPVLVRNDPTSKSVINPRVVLHPTDNALRISVSVFPTDNSSGVSEPAAANAPEMAEDVFVCEIPNIPLQSWFSVSLTVFGRNLDVYLNGMLVKSCFMSGVPKPAIGDIRVTPDGGFSGNVCGVATTNKMLNPSDALQFYSSDSTCRTQSTADASGPVADTTGYSVKFGIFDTLGRQIRQYTF